MFSVSAVAGRLSAGRGLPLWAAIAVSLWMSGMGSSVMAEPASAPRDFSGWRGGIGITFGTPSRDIADVTEMGYEIVWGGEDQRAIKTLGVSVFRYWNSIVETSLKGSGYDFSRMPDKDEAAKLASAAAPAGEAGVAHAGAVNAEGKVEEVKRREAGLDRITGRSPEKAPLVARYRRDIANGIYLFVDSGQPEETVCDAKKLGVRADTLVFDEFAGRVLEAKCAAGALTFKIPEGPSLV